ncbi:hypothetical protein SDC9_204021 [bioreactor metagenome]|uniref:Uncharacterized protein n=1 Tax=bioreactor metagenome TaxID=1076179 RepID=A0A645J9Z2_9ZZZZ
MKHVSCNALWQRLHLLNVLQEHGVPCTNSMKPALGGRTSQLSYPASTAVAKVQFLYPQPFQLNDAHLKAHLLSLGKMGTTTYSGHRFPISLTYGPDHGEDARVGTANQQAHLILMFHH